jgi:adenine-specific DNA-methyltransferase
MATRVGRKRSNRKAAKPKADKRAEPYRHPEAELPQRPPVGAQAQFRKRKPPATYRYDSSLSPALDWDGRNPAREQGEAAIRDILDLDGAAIDGATTAEEAKAAAKAALAKAKDAARKLESLGKPFLDWTGKAERLSFDVPTLPLFVHERLSTKAIVETLKSHEKRAAQADMFDLFGDPRRSVADQVLKAYEYKDKWVNRLILGDSLVVMNSLLQYENLGGQVQMIYIDPPYGVKFGSNFQPFVRKRDVSHNDDGDMTREPEMVKAYRDTWELGLHSYLTYLRDRLLLARDLLHPSGSVFVQIGDENVHHVRELMDEIFDARNFVSKITFSKTAGATPKYLPSTADYLVWYAKNVEQLKYRQIFLAKSLGGDASEKYDQVELADGTRRPMTSGEKDNPASLPQGSRAYRLSDLTSQRQGREAGPGSAMHFSVEFEGETFTPKGQRGWSTTREGMQRLIAEKRIQASGSLLAFVRFVDDFPAYPLSSVWTDIGGIQSRADPKVYVVQTANSAIQRCVLMTTDPGDLILDPTCGSGTTAYVAEQWGRRWIAVDTSRVPMALARQRLITGTFPYYELQSESRGPAGGFVYLRKQNKKGEETGGIVAHTTLGNIANNEPPQEEVLVDRPEVDTSIVRVTGPFTVEATIPSPIDLDGGGTDDTSAGDHHAPYVERMLEVLRRSPVLQLGGGRTIRLRNIRPPAKSLALSAEAVVDGDGSTLQSAVDAAHEINTGGLKFSERAVAIVFGPENGAVSDRLVFEAAREARAKNYHHLYVIGFAIQANARQTVEACEAIAGIAATYVTATNDLAMGDLLKTTRSSQIFSVCGMPEVAVRKLAPEKAGGPPRYQVELLGLDVFDPVTMELDHRSGGDVPAWLLDADYNGLVFHGSQVFFPRTGAWESLKKALKATHDETVWDHLAGTTSAPFEAGEHGQIAVKVIDDRGNELLVVKNLKDSG